MGNQVRTVTDATFASDVLASDKPVLVDFWADWCGPCRSIAPILDELATEYGDRIDVVKVNVDTNPEVISEYDVASVPTMKIYFRGQVAKSIVGAKPKSVLLSNLAEFL